MATANGNRAIQTRMKDTIESAQKRLASFEKDAQKLAKDFLARSHDAQKEFTKEFDRLRKRVSSGDFIDQKRLKALRGRAREIRGDVVGRLEELQENTLSFIGVATHEQVSALAEEIKKLSKKVDAMAKSARSGRASATNGS